MKESYATSAGASIGNGSGSHGSPVDTVIDRLTRNGYDPRPAGSGKWESRCPGHKGSKRNLSVTEGTDGAVLLRCHQIDEAGRNCPAAAIVAELGMEMKDLFVRLPGPPAASNGKPKAKAAGFDTPRDAADFLGKKLNASPVAHWIYRNRDRAAYSAVYRFDLPDGKSYRPVSVDPATGLWRIKDPPGKWLPYRVDEIAPADRVLFFEGEKCVDLARGLGLVATTTAHGAQSPHKTDLAALAGKEVVIVPDAGGPGEGYAGMLLGLLAKLQPTPTVKVLRLPGLAESEDIEQWVGARAGTTAADLGAELVRLAEACPVTNPNDIRVCYPPADGPPPAGPPTRTSDDGAEPPEDVYAGLSDEDLGIVRLASVECRPIKWSWKYRFSRGGLSMMAGDGGIGKSQLLLWIATQHTIGGEWADGSGRAPIGDVVIVSAEDRPDETIKPRLKAMGADISRVTIIKAKFIIRKPGKTPQVHPASFQNLPYWKEVFRRLPECNLFIADPVPSYLGRGVNDSKNTEIRSVLEPFIDEVIAPRDICMIGNTHLNKSVDAKTPMHRISGSIAYGNLPRNVHFVVRDPENPERRFFKQAKCNNAPDNLPALAFKVETREVMSEAGEPIETAVPVFEAETVAVDLGDVVNGTKGAKRGPDAEKTMALAEWLHDFLAGRPGPTPLGAIFDAAGEKGLIGHKRPEDNKWTSGSVLYEARKRVPSLLDPRSGGRIDDLKASIGSGGRAVVHWYLVSLDSAF